MTENTNESATPSQTAESVPTSAPANVTSAAENAAPDVRTADDVWNAPISDETTETKVETVEQPKAEEPEKVETTDKPDDEDEVLNEIFADKKDEKDEEITDDAEKMIAAQRSKQARIWATRRDNRAKPVDAFLDAAKPISDVAVKFAELNPARYTELEDYAAHKLIDASPEGTFQRAYVMAARAKDPNFDYKTAQIPTLEQVISNSYAAQPAQSAQAADIQSAAQELTDVFGEEWRNPENDANLSEDDQKIVRSVRALEKSLSDKNTETSEKDGRLKKLEDALAEVVDGKKTEEQKTRENTIRSKVEDYRSTVEAKMLPHLRKTTGLEITENDIPEIKDFKNSLTSSFYERSAYDKEHGYSSQFESYAFNESSVKDRLQEIGANVSRLQEQEADAEIKGDAATAASLKEAAADERVTFYQLFNDANKEFKALRIDPILKAFGVVSSNLSTNINNASQRVEVTGASSTHSQPVETDYKNADDVWNSMPVESAQAESLRSGA